MRYFLQNKETYAEVDTSTQRLLISMDEDYVEDDGSYQMPDFTEEDLDTPDLFDEEGGWKSPELHPRLHSSYLKAWKSRTFAPLTLFAAKAKQVDDRVIAAIESALEYGIGTSRGRRHLLKTIASHTEETEPALHAWCQAIREIGEMLPKDAPQTKESTKIKLYKKRYLKAWRADQGIMQALGVYSSSKELTALYRAGKVMQSALDEDIRQALVTQLSKHTELKHLYDHINHVQSILTNPPHQQDVFGSEDQTFFPPSDSAESKLIRKLFSDRFVPLAFDTTDTLIKAIRSGKIDTEPSKESGWYDHVLHAHSSLLNLQDSEQISYADHYKADLEDVFKALLGMTRESHVKQLDVPPAGCCGGFFRIAPRISVEPVPSYYARRADGYAFVRHGLTKLLGKEQLKSLQTNTLHRHGRSVYDELLHMELLLRGAWHISCEETGQHIHDLSEESERAAMFMRQWFTQAQHDPDLAADNRMMVPLLFDIETNKWQVLVCLGWENRCVKIDFLERPTVQTNAEDILWESHESAVPRAVFHTLWTSQLRSRKEVQYILKTAASRQDALAQLSQ